MKGVTRSRCKHPVRKLVYISSNTPPDEHNAVWLGNPCRATAWCSGCGALFIAGGTERPDYDHMYFYSGPKKRSGDAINP